MATVEEQRGDAPLPRFGHTTTLVGGTRVVLFGGATGDSGRYTITADAYVLDISSNTWERLQPEGSAPSARAAHAAACVDQFQLVIYGGATGGGSLSSDELYLLDFRSELQNAPGKTPGRSALPSQWMSVPIQGVTPGRRYGHTMVFNKPLLIVFGGNNGQSAENDIWFLDVERAPFTWNQVTLNSPGKAPAPRVYHSAEVCREGPAAGMMVVFGGRTQENRSLKDTWGLRQHRDGRWDWVEAPTKRGVAPEARFQHSAIFFGTQLIVVGGRGDDVSKSLPTSLYDTETCEWVSLPPMNRFRHSCWGLKSLLFAYGGFDHKNPSAPTNTLQVLDLAALPEVPSTRQSAARGGDKRSQSALPAVAAQQAPGTPSSPVNSTNPQIAAVTPGFYGSATPAPSQLNAAPRAAASAPPRGQITPTRNGPGMGTPAKGPPPLVGQEIRIAGQVVVALDKDFTHLVRKVSIDRLEDEGRKINKHAPGSLPVVPETEHQTLHGFVIDSLLKPTEWIEPDPNTFLITKEQVSELCDTMLDIMKKQPMMLQLRAPIKVYGDIHGQYPDLMRLFARYKAPTDGEHGDIETLDYLFLGDYVDRGSYSLETMCLLFALKIKYPYQVHLIRGNHEDPTINHIYGFREECRRRLREDPDDENSCWNKFNNVFEWMPVGAVIEDRILCIHGGIGGTINSVDDIAQMPRPLKVAQVPSNSSEQRVTDLLWSDPTDSDNIEGVTVNETRDPDGSGRIVKYGPDRVSSFLKANNLSMIIRAHECVMDGFERFAGGKLITLFSATDYCGHHKNAGALLFIRRDLTVVPKIIYPVERSNTNWDNTSIQQRPPTPPRPVPRARRDDF